MAPDSKSPRPMRTDSPVSLWEDVSRELWEVQLLGGTSRLMSNDEIDAALAAGELGPRTLVRKHGASAWTTLRDLRGLEPSALAPAPPQASALEAAPMAIDVVAVPPSRRPPPLPLAVQNRPIAPRIDVAPLSTEELAVARPNSPLGKIIAVAAVALAFGGIFAAMSARVSGARAPEPTSATTATTTTTATQAATQAAPPPPAPPATTAKAASVAVAGANAAPATASAPAPKPTPEAAATAARALAAAGAQAAPATASAPTPSLAAMARSSVVGTQRAPAPAPGPAAPPAVAHPAPVHARATSSKHETAPKKVAAAPTKKSAKTVEARKAAPAKKGATAHPRHRAAHLKPKATPARAHAAATPKHDARRTNRK